MRADAEKFIALCPKCLQLRESRRNTPPLQAFRTSYPMELLNIDLLELSTTPTGNKYVLMIIDHFSKYMITEAVPDKQAQTVARALVEKVICNEGSPVRIHSDLGGEFINEILNEICKLLDIQHTTTLGYDPSNNGAVERSNRTFIELIKHRDIHDIKAWDSILPYLTHSYNVTPHSTTHFSPFNLFRCRTPLKPDCPAIVENSFPIYTIDSDSYLQEFKEEYSRIIAAGKFNSDISRENMKYFHDLKADVSSKLLKIDDLVMIKATVVKNKLQNRSYGPYKIIAINKHL